MSCKIVICGDHWCVILKNGEEVFKGETLQDCEAYCEVNGLTVYSMWDYIEESND